MRLKLHFTIDVRYAPLNRKRMKVFAGILRWLLVAAALLALHMVAIALSGPHLEGVHRLSRAGQAFDSTRSPISATRPRDALR